MQHQLQITQQLQKLNTLLRDSAFAIDIARKQDAELPPDNNDMRQKKIAEEKIAINLAGFYAVECGINALMEEKGETAYYWLNKISRHDLDSADALLLNRFANATWKAGQPFKSLSSITRANFVTASFLDAQQSKKDEVQVTAAALKLFEAMKAVNKTAKDEQLKIIAALLQDQKFAIEMAAHMHSSYFKAENKAVPPFISPDEESIKFDKSIFEEKVAINIAGFYALECGLGYFATAKNKIPLEVLNAIIDESIDKNDKRLLERFANATWKAGQPFRSLERITRDVFVPFSFLGDEQIAKDWKQIKSAAAEVLRYF